MVGVVYNNRVALTWHRRLHPSSLSGADAKTIYHRTGASNRKEQRPYKACVGEVGGVIIAIQSNTLAPSLLKLYFN